MAWIPLHQTLPRHPKLLRLANRLGIHPAQAAGHLAFFWMWCLDYAPGGNVVDLSVSEVASAAHYDGDAEMFCRSLEECGWIDSDGKIHDWNDYGGKLEAERERCRGKMKAFRAQKRALRERTEHVPVTYQERTEHVPVTYPSRYGLDKIREDKIREEERKTLCAHPGNAGHTEPPSGFPKSVEEAKSGSALCGVAPDLAERAWLLAASRGWCDAKGVPIRSWRHYVAFCGSMERGRVAEEAARNGKGAIGGQQTIRETIPLPIIDVNGKEHQ